MHPRSDHDVIRDTHNTARYFSENRQVGWVLLIVTVLWGVMGYFSMPKLKDPRVPVRVAAAVCVWPGATAEKIEQLITKRIEAKIAENANVEEIKSNTRGSAVVVYVFLKEGVSDVGKVFDDIAIKLNTITDLPLGAQPVMFFKDFGDTANLLLTVASPKVGDVELELRAKSMRAKIEEARQGTEHPEKRATIISAFPMKVSIQSFRRIAAGLAPQLEDLGRGRDFKFVEGSGFMGIDFEPTDDSSDEQLINAMLSLVSDRLRRSEVHPDVWPLFIVRNPAQTFAKLGQIAGDKYTYRELDDFTEAIQRRLQAVGLVSKVSRSGVLPERIYLEYSQTRLAALGVNLGNLDQIITARNITFPGGIIEVDRKNLLIDPSGALKNEQELGDVLVGASPTGLPIYLRDVASIDRSYDSPPRFLNHMTFRNEAGDLQRGRAVTIAVNMRDGEQIHQFGEQVDAALAEVRALLPEDLIIRRTSDQPRQVEDAIDLFMKSLVEAIIFVVIVALIGFWEWRSALLMALSIPITLAMTFGMMSMLKMDVQQVSVASLIIALGLLVDDPVVAGDAIKRSLGEGHTPIIAAWLGPTKLATAILFATITNIVAYLPFLLLKGEPGQFIFALPVVMTASLVASRIVSMSFIPLLGYYLLRAEKQEDPEAYRKKAFARIYMPFASWCLAHRKLVLGLSLIPLVGGLATGLTVKSSFFPKDESFLSFVDVWLPEDATLTATRDVVDLVEKRIADACAKYAQEHEKHPEDVLESITTFVGGGAPRFWFSIIPEQEQLNYAQLILQVKDKHDTPHLVSHLQDAVADIPGARIDVRELENGPPVGLPVSVRITGEEIPVLRDIAEKVKTIVRKSPYAERVRDDWGSDSFSVKLHVDPDKANFAGITNLEVAISSISGMNGRPVGQLREGTHQIPIIARLRAEERAQLEDVQNLYVYGMKGQKVPLRQVSRVGYALETEKIRRRNHFRTITVGAYPSAGHFPSEITAQIEREVEALGATLPPGYKVEMAGELAEQKKGFLNLAMVMFVSVAAIFGALVIQFKSAVKPILVFASLPYGMAGAIAAVAMMRSSFGFMAFMGIISLIGVIVSHIIVLFDLIEEMREHGVALRDALLDAAILRIRPVLITVGATVLGLFPLASHGGALWEPLCYAQIGGLTIATALTLVLVPVMYAIMVVDLKWIDWPTAPPPPAARTAMRRIPASVTAQHLAHPIAPDDRTQLDVSPFGKRAG